MIKREKIKRNEIKEKKEKENTLTNGRIIHTATIYEKEGADCKYELYMGMLVLEIAGQCYSVQVGVFRELAKAQVYSLLVLSVYRGKGVYLVKREAYYCVRIGYFGSREKAYAVIVRIKSLIKRENRYLLWAGGWRK